MRYKMFLVLVLILAILPLKAAAGPIASMHKTQIELPMHVKAGQPALGRFGIQNPGTNALVIEKVKGS